MSERLRGRYEPLDVVGRGGQGEVVKALDHLHNRVVAIKVRRSTPERQEALLEEARTLLNLEPHRGLPIVRDDFFEGDRYYMVMDWIEGTNLQHVLEQRGDPGLPYSTVLAYLSPVAEALDHLHAQEPPVVHQDVKPANLVLTGRGRVVLVDLGIASSGRAPTGLGTSGYIAPELAAGEEPTPAADIFSLAATAHALLTGTPPRGDRPVWEDVPEDRVKIVERSLGRALSADPQRRPGSAGELLERLGTRLESQPVRVEPIPSAPSPPPGRPWFPRSLVSSRPRLVATVVALALVAAGIPLALTRFIGGTSPVAIRENAVGLLDAQSGRLITALDMESVPGAIAFGAGAVWVTNSGGSVFRIDPKERTVTQTIEVGQHPAGIVVGEGAVWVTSARERTVSRINPSTNTVVQSIEVGNGPEGIAVGEDEIWVSNKLDNTVVRIDPGTNSVTTTIPVGGSPSGIAFGHGAAWVAHETEAAVSRIDPQTGAVTATIAVGNGPRNVIVAQDGVWVANRLDGTVSKIDPTTNAVAATLPAGEGAGGIAVAPDAVWVASELGGSVTRFEPGETRGTTIPLRTAVLDLALVDETLWFTTRGSPTSHRGGTLNLVSSEDQWPTIDPAIAQLPIHSLVGDGLVGYKRVGGVDGSTLVPDLATSIPRPTDGGTTYTFRLRPGIRYSNDEPVRASDIRRAIERVFRLESLARSGYHRLVGSDACQKAPARCNLSGGIQTDDDSGAITFRLTAPDPDFLYDLASPAAYAVPPGTLDEDLGTEPVPATGPYMITRYAPGKLMELKRNPHFRQWTRQRPEGFVDRIVWRMDVASEDLIDQVLEGRADAIMFPGLIPPDQLDRVTTEFTQLAHTYTRAGTWHFFLNTRLPPFDDIRVRRAVNFAVDRRRMLDLFPFPGSRVTCQILPPGFAGYRPYCPYTVDPGPAGTWTAPDLSKARALVAASGTVGTKVIVWEFPVFERVGRYFVSLLEELGYRARLRVIEDPEEFFEFVFDSGNEVQTGGMSWLSETRPSPEEFLGLLSCEAFVPDRPDQNFNAAAFCDPKIDEQIERARQVQLSDPAAAGPLWARIDRAVVDQAPWVAAITPGWVDVVSRRLGNYQANLLWGMLFDQVWVR